MDRLRTRRFVARGLLAAAVFLAALTFALPTQAHDGWGGAYGRRGRVVRGCGCGDRYARSYGCDALHRARFIARGHGWQLLRRGLYRDVVRTTHRHPSYHYLRRWPYASHDTGYGWGGRICAGADFGPQDCDIVNAALDETERLTDPDDLLGRGTERLFYGKAELAAADLRAVLAARPDDARARYGLALASALAHDWDDSAENLRRLADQGELRAEDRLAEGELFDDESALGTLRQGLVAWTQYHFMDVDAQVTAAWLLLASGQEAQARGHVRSALRFAPEDPAALRLKAALDGSDGAEGAEGAAPPPEAPAPAPDLAPPRGVAATGG